MISSMTAFARIQAQGQWGSLVWEIRSVNHRYLELSFHLPEYLRDIEPDVRNISRKCLSRGKVECSLKLLLSDTRQSLNLNPIVLANVKNALAEINDMFPDTQPINPLDILNWPGVQMIEEVNLSPVRKAAIKGFEDAMVTLIHTRQREGAELSSFIDTRLTQAAAQINLLRTLLPSILSEQQQKLLNRLKDIKQEFDPNRLEQEMVTVAQKLDIEEELDRLDIHIAEVKRILLSNKKSISIGRRLDFLMQELNRETNTLSSKSINADLTQAAVNLKVLIEQMREQVQNIQ
ncbi:MAG: YicC family protein [Endozoicomonas sp. (ex Botrylloides leachii)]|nr:YicC family protein [Endozoicomonas sp. (ex Botrylloides leachii)]